MKLQVLFFTILFLLFFISCNQNHDYIASNTLSNEQSQLLTKKITRFAAVIDGVNLDFRFDAKYDSIYDIENIKYILQFYHSTDTNNYFLLKKKVPSIHGNNRYIGIAGKFQFKDDKILNYEEVFYVPALDSPVFEQRAKLVFEEYIKTNSIKKYFLNYDFIDFPDERVSYDKVTMRWIRK